MFKSKVLQLFFQGDELIMSADCVSVLGGIGISPSNRPASASAMIAAEPFKVTGENAIYRQ